MNKLTQLIVFLNFFCATINAQISGTVFRDFNANGVQNTPSTGVAAGEVGVPNITIRAYDADDAVASPTSSATTSANGSYTLSGLVAGTSYRIEFIVPDAYDYSGPVGNHNQSSVRFINYTATLSGVNFGINFPENYCQTLNPNLMFTRMVNGNPTGGGSSGTTEALITAPYNSTGQTPPFNIDALQSEIGSTWGVSYNRSTKKFYTAAVIRRHAGLGPNGLGAIYVTDYNGAGTPTSLLIDIDPISDVGDLPDNATRGLPANVGDPSQDLAALSRVAKQGIGDIDLSEDNNFLYAVNLNKRNIVKIDLTNYNLTGALPSAANVSEITIPSISCNNGVLRPWALKYYKGMLYLGMVCTGELAEGTPNDLYAYVYKFDGTTWSNAMSSNLQLNYAKESDTEFEVWSDNPSDFTDYSPGAPFFHDIFLNQQPIVSDIEFDVNGDMIIGFIDRTGIQWGPSQPVISGLDPAATFTNVILYSEVLRASKNAINWTWENNGVAGSLTGCGSAGSGPGGREFYCGDAFPNHPETSQGGLALLAGTGEVVMTAQDPVRVTSSGIRFMSNTNGSTTDQAEFVEGFREDFAKAQAMGDIELMCDPAPIEIGNRVWNDTDQDGVQDPGEAAIAGVSVQLVKSGTVIATAMTNSEGNYYFSSASGTTSGNAIYNITQLTPNMTYTVRIPNATGQAPLSGLSPTTANVGGSGLPDVRDSDGTLVSTNVEATILATVVPISGANNHTFDFGFSTLPPCTLTLSNVQVSSCTCTSTAGYMDPTGLTNLLSGGTFGTSGTYNNVPIPGQGTVDILYSYNGTGNTLTPDFRYLDVANGLPISTDFSSLGITGTVVPGIRNKVNTGNTGVLNFSFDQPTSNINLFVFDVDWDDQVTVTAWDAYGNPITNFSGWTVITGDLTAPIDAPNAIWNPTTHTISSSSNVNGERNFTSLEPDVAVSKVVFSFTGTTDPNSNAPHTQYAIYSNLNASTCTATVTADVSWTNAPSGQNINVTSGGFTKVIDVVGGATSPQTVSFTIVPDGTTHPITAVFDGDPTCTDTENYTAPASCSPTCNLNSTGLTNVQCNSNSTSATSTDDYITFSLNPSGTLIGSTYTVSSNNGGILTPTSGSYGVTTNFRLQNGSANGSTVYTITVTDASGAPCQISVDIGPISPCSSCPNPNCGTVTVIKN